ncbi:MAG: hypothetical protein J7J87_00760 [Candidatus Diapherotrites archaeon]|nr:hypothetical protein [Candidatus Diapherotrites archaeon]
MPKGRFIRRKAGKKKSGFLAPAVEDMLSKEKANVRARRVFGRAVLTTKVQTASGETLSRSISIIGKKRTITAASRVGKDKLLSTKRRSRGIKITRTKK